MVRLYCHFNLILFEYLCMCSVSLLTVKTAFSDEAGKKQDRAANMQESMLNWSQELTCWLVTPLLKEIIYYINSLQKHFHYVFFFVF